MNKHVEQALDSLGSAIKAKQSELARLQKQLEKAKKEEAVEV